MSKKFEQLLDYLVNEDMDKANALFHEIVVEKSREIYGDLIAEETEEDESKEESKDTDDESVEEAKDTDDDLEESDDDETVEENMACGDESMYEIGGDASDDMLGGVVDKDAMGMGGDDMAGGDAMGGEMDSDQPATKGDMLDIKDDLAELKAEFEALLASEQGEAEHEGEIDDFDADGDTDVTAPEDEFAADDESDDAESDDEEDTEADEQFMREYREVIGKPYHGGKVAGTTEDGGTNTKSVVSSAKDRPTTKASASNIAQDSKGADPKPGVGGVLKKGGEFVKKGTQNVDGAKAKGYSEKSQGHGAEKSGKKETQVNDKPIIGK